MKSVKLITLMKLTKLTGMDAKRSDSGGQEQIKTGKGMTMKS